MRFGSLFTGYGGLSLAVDAVFGARTVWTSENDPDAAKIVAHRFPGVPNLGDITTIDWAEVREQYGPVDGIEGGFPCQDLSDAGARKGLVPGTRSGLWFEYVRAIRELRPEWVVIENVQGLLTGRTAESEDVVRVGPRGGKRVERTHRALGRVLRDLADLGFDAEWRVLRASDVGAPHRRARVFLLARAAHARGEAGPVGGRLQPAGPGPSGRPGGRPDDSGGAIVELLPTPSAGVFNDGEDLASWEARRQRNLAKGVNGNGQGTPLPIAVQLLPTPTGANSQGNAQTGPNETLPGSVQQLEGQALGKYTEACDRWAPIVGRHWPEPTMPASRGDGRRLNPPFVEWMQGLPAGWVTEVPDLSRSAQLKSLGNGVVPQQAYAAVTDLYDRIMA